MTSSKCCLCCLQTLPQMTRTIRSLSAACARWGRSVSGERCAQQPVIPLDANACLTASLCIQIMPHIVFVMLHTSCCLGRVKFFMECDYSRVHSQVASSLHMLEHYSAVQAYIYILLRIAILLAADDGARLKDSTSGKCLKSTPRLGCNAHMLHH